jgi:hypothetical protein
VRERGGCTESSRNREGGSQRERERESTESSRDREGGSQRERERERGRRACFCVLDDSFRMLFH